ncbi:hypothetical protein NKI17_29335, partial [Mesorhizobium sp. M0816]
MDGRRGDAEEALHVALAAELFETTEAIERVLVIRDASQLSGCAEARLRLEKATTRIIDYGSGDLTQEPFHVRIVLADGVAAYVGSANLLRRSKVANPSAECYRGSGCSCRQSARRCGCQHGGSNLHEVLTTKRYHGTIANAVMARVLAQS